MTLGHMQPIYTYIPHERRGSLTIGFPTYIYIYTPTIGFPTINSNSIVPCNYQTPPTKIDDRGVDATAVTQPVAYAGLVMLVFNKHE